MHGRLAFTLNDDGTITLRCDADAFFAHADEIRRLLTSPDDDPLEHETPEHTEHATPAHTEQDPLDRARLAHAALSQPTPPTPLDTPWSRFWARTFPTGAASSTRDLSARALELLATGHFLNRHEGAPSFARVDLTQLLQLLPGERAAVASSSLSQLARRGFLERVRRGSYRLTPRAHALVLQVGRHTPPVDAPTTPPADADARDLALFLRSVPTSRKWRRVLLVAYFLHTHRDTETFDKHTISHWIERLPGLDVPGSLPALISQVLCKRHRVLERAGARGRYRLAPQALDALRNDPDVADADARLRARATRTMARTG